MAIESSSRLRDRSHKVGAGDIAVQVRRRITGGELLNGERLPPERAFAEQFGVSRGTVRDALRRLEEAGFVEKRPGSGTYVTCSEVETASIARSTSPLELIDTRYALEPQIVRLAVLNATERALAKADGRSKSWSGARTTRTRSRRATRRSISLSPSARGTRCWSGSRNG